NRNRFLQSSSSTCNCTLGWSLAPDQECNVLQPDTVLTGEEDGIIRGGKGTKIRRKQ
ncbi:hypothetical protein AAFF_G00174700, partial [Aldrovandia affinis]